MTASGIISAGQAARDWVVAYAKRYPDKPAPVVRPYPGGFEVQEGWAKRRLTRAGLKAETAAMFTQAAGGGMK